MPRAGGDVRAGAGRSYDPLEMDGRVGSIIDSMPEPSHTLARIAWDGRADIARSGPLVNAAITGLGLSSAQVDEMFRAGAALVV